MNNPDRIIDFSSQDSGTAAFLTDEYRLAVVRNTSPPTREERPMPDNKVKQCVCGGTQERSNPDCERCQLLATIATLTAEAERLRELEGMSDELVAFRNCRRLGDMLGAFEKFQAEYAAYKKGK